MTRRPISQAIEARLHATRVARLATLGPKYPHVVPVCFVYDGAVFYTAVDRKPKRVAPRQLARLRHIRSSPEVALLVDHYDEDWTRLWFVLARGKAALVPRSKERERAEAIRLLKAKYPQYAAGMLADDAPLIRITPERFVSWGRI
jgi:PPOX class probable F420-dependent enzyme